MRLLVSLKSEVRFTPQKLGTKTVTGENMIQYGGEQTYNVWGIVDGSLGGEVDSELPVAGTMTMKLDNENGAEYVNNTTTERNVYIAVNNGQDNAGGSGHKITTYTVLKDGQAYLANQIGPNTLTEPGTYTITVTTTDKAGNVATRGGYVVKKIEAGKSPSQLFDQAGTNPDGLHIGDFVNYDAGTWTQAEINEIKTGLKTNLVTANGKRKYPVQNFQFGGFEEGTSRNGEPARVNNYIKEVETGQVMTGWRVFDVEGNTVTLISAGNPEGYYHNQYENEGKSGYISEYILTGNVNNKWTNGATESLNFQKRDWSKYVNTAQKAQSATPITKSRLDNWYTKYTNTPNADTYRESTFQKIYQEPYIKYQNLIDNYEDYWVVEEWWKDMLFMFAKGRLVGCDEYEVYPFGLRILVTLSSEVKLKPQKIGTKTLIGGNMTQYGGEQTYNVWGIAGTVEDKESPIAGTMTMKLNDANGGAYTNGTETTQSVYISVNNGQDTVGGSGHLMTTYTVLKDGRTYLENQIEPNTLTETGTYTITVTTTDNAGNIATREGYTVIIKYSGRPGGGGSN